MPLTTAWLPPASTMVPLATPPETVSKPPPETVVPFAVPLE